MSKIHLILKGSEGMLSQKHFGIFKEILNLLEMHWNCQSYHNSVTFHVHHFESLTSPLGGPFWLRGGSMCTPHTPLSTGLHLFVFTVRNCNICVLSICNCCLFNCTQHWLQQVNSMLHTTRQGQLHKQGLIGTPPPPCRMSCSRTHHSTWSCQG